MNKSELFESILAESLQDDYEQALGDWICGMDLRFKSIKNKIKKFKKQFKVLYRYIALPYDSSYIEESQNIWKMKVGDIFNATPCSTSIIPFCSKLNYKKYVDCMCVFTGNSSDADLLEMIFHNAEGWQVPQSVYDKNNYEDSDYAWQKEVILDGKYRITKIMNINDPQRPTLKKKVFLEKC